jgi:hypothetical protein
MSEEVRAALAGGLFGVLGTLVPVLFAYLFQLRQQRAIEAGKQSEAIRVEALRALSAVMASLGAVSDLLRWNIALEAKLPSADEVLIQRLIGPLQKEGKALLDAYLSAQIYLDRSIGQDIMALRETLEYLTLTAEGMQEKKQQIDAAITRLHEWSNRRFLDLAGEIRSLKAG